MEGRVVIVGAGHAGGAAAIALRELGYSGAITLLGDEQEPPYERPSLSKAFLAGKDAQPTYLATPDRWAALSVSLKLGAPATAIDRQACEVLLSGGTREPYDRLILATGGAPRRLPLPSHRQIFVLRTADDARAIAAAARPGRRAVVVGGGVIGLETASTLRDIGLEVAVVEAGSRLLGRNVPSEAAEWLARAHARRGVELRLGRSVAALDGGGAGEALSLRLDDSSELAADFIVVGIGVVPRAELAQAAGLPVVASGVLVDADYSSPADRRIFAIGDLAARRPDVSAAAQRQETWAHAQTSARAAALAILSRSAEPEPAPWFWTDQCGHHLQIVGDPAQSDAVVARGPSVRLYLRGDVLLGAACLDEPREFAAARRLVGTRLSAVAAADPGTDLRKAAA